MFFLLEARFLNLNFMIQNYVFVCMNFFRKTKATREVPKNAADQ
jgi:hypothetical protein